MTAHSQSGELSGYSPDGRYLGLLVGERWKLVDRANDLSVRDLHPRVVKGSSNNVLQWTPDGRVLRLRGDRIEFWSPESNSVESVLDLPPVDVSALAARGREVKWRNWRSGDATGERFLHVVHTVGTRAGPGEKASDSRLIHNWIAVVDAVERRIVRVFPFDSRVHRGDATASRWHHLFGAGAHFLTTLSAMGPPGSPHFRFDRDGGGWTRLNLVGERDAEAPLTLPWSHPTYDETRVAFGSDNRVHLLDFVSGESLGTVIHPREGRGGYGHGALAGDHLVYSFYDREQRRDASLHLWNWRSEAAPRRVVVLEAPTGEAAGVTGVMSRARPFVTPQGDEVAWHALAADGRRFVTTSTVALGRDSGGGVGKKTLSD